MTSDGHGGTLITDPPVIGGGSSVATYAGIGSNSERHFTTLIEVCCFNFGRSEGTWDDGRDRIFDTGEFASTPATEFDALLTTIKFRSL
jgi:hypothetical protein